MLFAGACVLGVCPWCCWFWCGFLGCFAGVLKNCFIYYVYKTLSKLLFFVIACIGCRYLLLVFLCAVGLIVWGCVWLLVFCGWLPVLFSLFCRCFVGCFIVFIVFVYGGGLPWWVVGKSPPL